jgi:hypothetical protein
LWDEAAWKKVNDFLDKKQNASVWDMIDDASPTMRAMAQELLKASGKGTKQNPIKSDAAQKQALKAEYAGLKDELNALLKKLDSDYMAGTFRNMSPGDPEKLRRIIKRIMKHPLNDDNKNYFSSYEPKIIRTLDPNAAALYAMSRKWYEPIQMFLDKAGIKRVDSNVNSWYKQEQKDKLAGKVEEYGVEKLARDIKAKLDLVDKRWNDPMVGNVSPDVRLFVKHFARIH